MGVFFLDSLITSLRQILGDTSGFWHSFQGSSSYDSYNWDYGMMLEYAVSAIVLITVINWVFRLLKEIFTL